MSKGKDVGALFEQSTKNSDKRPMVFTNWEHHIQVDAVFRNLTAADPQSQTVFKQGSALVVVEGAPARGVVLEEASLDTRISRAMRVVAPSDSEDGDGTKPATISSRVVKSVIKEPGAPLPELLRVVNAPFFDAGGNLVSETGYHPASKTYCDLDGFEAPREVPAKPSAKDVREAKDLLIGTLLDGFRLAKDSDTAHAIAFGLEFYVREMINGPLPLHSFQATVPGAGKGKLVYALSYPALGDAPKGGVMPNGEQELAKKLFADLRESPALILFDNVKRSIDSQSLESATTEHYFNSRILGISSSAAPRVRCGWAMTVNNPNFSRDAVRRTVRTLLDPKTDRPEERDDFKTGDLETWVPNNRGMLVWSFLVLVQNWIAKGKPAFSGTKLGSYESWSNVIGGIMQANGIPGFLEDRNEFMSDSTTGDDEEWEEAVEAWWARFQGDWVKAKDLVQVLCEENGFDLGVSDHRRIGADKRLGLALRKVAGKSYAGYRLCRANAEEQTKRESKNGWRLVDENKDRKPEPKPRRRPSRPRRGGDSPAQLAAVR